MSRKSRPTKDAASHDATVGDPRWSIIINRDAGADGTFFYSVRTTGVYCRPSCPTRTAKPENIQFHTTCDAAERAGFRPCKRCRPNELALSAQQAARIEDLCRYIETAERAPSLAELAARAGLSAFHLHRLFKAATGLTPKAYAAAARARRVRSSLKRSAHVTDAIYDAGYNSSGRFYERSNEFLGMTPTAFRSGGSKVAISFAVGECSLGSILIALSARGICAILLGDDPQALVKELQDEFPRAEFHGGDANFERLVARVVGFVEEPRIGLDLPLDIRGAAFQQRVWEALRGVPVGETVSYAEIARLIGAPKAARAVGRACAANRIAVAIPCHRVVRLDGQLSGYRWGIDRKRALLKREEND